MTASGTNICFVRWGDFKFLPELIYPRLSLNMQIRTPPYISEAQLKEGQKVKQIKKTQIKKTL